MEKSGSPDQKIREAQEIREGIQPQSALRFPTEKPTLPTALMLEMGKVENEILGNSKEESEQNEGGKGENKDLGFIFGKN